MIVVLVGPSAVGKSTIAAALVSRGYRQLISCTTRAPRPGERDGRDYHFRTQDQFDSLVAKGMLAEHSGSFGHSYGMPRTEIAGPGPAVAVLDLRGALVVKAAYADKVVTFALRPASWDVLETRLQERGGTAEDTARRLATARAEVRVARRACDEELVCGQLDRTVVEVMSLAAAHVPWPAIPNRCIWV